MLFDAPVEGTVVPRDRTASSSSPGPGPPSILRRCGDIDALTRRQLSTKFDFFFATCQRSPFQCPLRADAAKKVRAG